MELVTQARTDVGKVRSSNQDSFFVSESESLFVVADGMGGHAGGEIASKLAIESFRNYMNSNPDEPLNLAMENAINHACSQIYEKALEQPTLKGMGTTLTALKIRNNIGYFGHVGDSRIYLVRSGFIFQLTHDHSLVSEQVRAGVLTADEAKNHHLKNVITRSVGYQEEEDVDTSEFSLEGGDILIICSDGLHGMVKNNEITSVSNELGGTSASKLVDLALKGGGEDNVTVVSIEIKKLKENK